MNNADIIDAFFNEMLKSPTSPYTISSLQHETGIVMDTEFQDLEVQGEMVASGLLNFENPHKGSRYLALRLKSEAVVLLKRHGNYSKYISTLEKEKHDKEELEIMSHAKQWFETENAKGSV